MADGVLPQRPAGDTGQAGQPGAAHRLPPVVLANVRAGTDVGKFTKETTVEAIPVIDPSIVEISQIIDSQLKEAYNDIRAELEEEDPEYLKQVEAIGPQALLQAPVTESLRGKAQSLTLLRKYLFSMIPSQLKKFLIKNILLNSIFKN